MPINQDDLLVSDLNFFVYSFAHKEFIELTVNPKTKDETFSIKLVSDDLTRHIYVEEVVDSVLSTAAKVFNNNIKSSYKRLNGVYITHINNVPVFLLLKLALNCKCSMNSLIRYVNRG